MVNIYSAGRTCLTAVYIQVTLHNVSVTVAYTVINRVAIIMQCSCSWEINKCVCVNTSLWLTSFRPISTFHVLRYFMITIFMKIELMAFRIFNNHHFN